MKTAIRALGFVLAATAVGPAAGQSLPLLPGPLPAVYPEILELPEDQFPRRFWFGVGTDFGRDGNVFRLQKSDSTATVGATGRPNSSWIYRLYAQANMDLRVDRQRFLVQASVSDYTFSGLSYLDYTAPEFRGAWSWQAGDALQGELRYEHLRVLTDFIDTRPVIQNLRNLDYGLATAQLAVTPRWRLTGGVIAYRATNSDVGFQAANTTQTTEEAGVRYVLTGAGYVGLVGAYSQGKYPDRVPTPQFDDQYTQTDFGAEVLYGVTDVSYLRGRIAYTRREYPVVTARNFSGLTGRIDFLWAISPRTGIDFLARREPAVFEDPTTSYYVTTALGVIPHWDIAPKLRLESSHQHWWRRYLGDPFATLAGLPQREDQLDFLGVSLKWIPSPNWLLRAGWVRSKRDSNQPVLDFTDDVVFGTVQFGF